MKNILLILLLILAFGGCKDDEQAEPDAMVYEDWRILPDSIIQYGYRDIVSTEYRNGVLHIQAKNSYYALDSNFNLYDQSSWKGINTKSLPYHGYNPEYSNEYGIMFNRWDGITVFDLDYIGSDQISIHFGKDFVHSKVTHWEYSEIDESHRFSVVTAGIEGDSAVWRLHNYLIDHTPGAFQPIKLLKEDNIILWAYEHNNPSPNAAFSVNRIEDKILAQVDGVLYTFQGGELEAASRFWINHAVEVGGDFYAINNRLRYISDNHETFNRLIVSNDKGTSWDYYNEENMYSSSMFKALEGKIFTFQNWFISVLDYKTNKMRSLNLDGLDAAIHTIEKVGNKVVVGTDVGVYYKSWESFLNK
jgi:hypothetical protein